MSDELDIATAPRRYSLHWKQETITWAAIRDWMKDPADHKECGNYVLGLLRETTSTHKRKDGQEYECTDLHRNGKAVVSRSALCLDIDYPAADLFDRIDLIFDGAAILHTTFSSAPDALRFRMLIRLSRAVTPEEYRHIAKVIMARLGVEQFDPGSSEPERYMFRPSAQRSEDFEWWEIDGEPLDVDEVLKAAPPAPTPSRATPSIPLEAYGGPTYETMSPGERALADAELERFVEGWRAKMADAATWTEVQREDGPKERRWEGMTTNCSWSIARRASMPWSGLDEDRAEALYNEILPEVMADDPKCAGKWYVGIVGKAAAKGVEPPPWDKDFTPVVGGDDDPAAAESAFTRDVEKEAHRLRVLDGARQLIARERLGDQPIPMPVGLAGFLAEPDEEALYRVAGLWPTNGRVVLSAQNKAGKTTMTGNLIRSLADDEPFLEKFAVEKAGRIVLLDNELSPRMIRQWLRDQSIENTDAVDVVTLRGRLSTFNLLDPATRSRWAAALQPADVLIFDCLRPALDALGLSEDKEAGRFLEALDELTSEAGINELLVVHHMGHSNERSRGDSRILDWPDAVWKLVREDADEPMSTRYFSAYGRDVDQPEIRIAFNPVDRHLVVNGGSRVDVKATQIEDDVLQFIQENPGCSQSEIETALKGDDKIIRKAAKSMDASGVIRREKEGQKKAHYPVEGGQND